MVRASAVLLFLALSGAVAPPSVAGPYDKSSIAFPDEPFAVPSTDSDPGWVKFVILTSDPGTVIFQDSNHYPFHYDFATNELQPFLGMTPGQFDAATLYQTGQVGILGAVILPPLVGQQPVIQEYGIQLIRQDPYPPTQVRDLFNAVRAAVAAGPEVQPFYFPAFEQMESAEQNRAFFESEGIPLGSTSQWADGSTCYAEGWALGRLKYFPAGLIDAAYLAGALLPGDVLLTDAVPAEIPYVAGVMSLSPSTPSSHVAILAATFHMPFVHLAVEEDAERAQDLVGHRMVLRAYGDPGTACQVRLIDVEGVLDASTIDEVLATLAAPPVLDIDPIEPYGAYSAPADPLLPSDIVYFGGKAANYGVLRRAIPDSSPVATALSFDLWTGFMDQALGNGNTLREEIAGRLAPFGYPPDMQALSAELDGIRDLIKDDDDTWFDPAAEAAVIATLEDARYGFDPYRKLRFRSSTNVEDSDRFTGAGLYDSYSGCLADDTDGDGHGPSHCDPIESDERTVFRAIRKVFASFYNRNAYLERLRHAIDEDQVGMAILVHHSFPDEIELANGVGTLRRGAYADEISLVTQAGASPVTNPEPGAIPEEIRGGIYYTPDPPNPPIPNVYLDLYQYSNLVQLGATVMDFSDSEVDEYDTLALLLMEAADEFEATTGEPEFLLEFEYKKVAPDDDLVVKQVRRIPQADDTPSITPFLIDEPIDYCLLQGEYGDVFGNHRLKARGSLSTASLWLTEANLQTSFYEEGSLEYAEVCQTYSQAGPLPQWPEFTHSYAPESALDGWRFADLQNPRSYEMETIGVPTLVAPSEPPLLTQRDFYCRYLRADYDRPVPTLDYNGEQTTTPTDYALYCPCSEPHPGDLLQQRLFDDGEGVTIDTTFYWPPRPEGIIAGYTAPAVRFVETVIAGLTATPVVLHGDYSQSYRPGHHNFSEDFLFEPALEPGIPQGQLDELETADVRAIHVRTGDVFHFYDDEAWGDGCLGCTGFDGDHDGRCTAEPTFDCDDGNAEAWSTPGEVRDLAFTGGSTLAWTEPAAPGGTSLVYDALRSEDAGDFVSDAVCIPWNEPESSATDGQSPPAGGLYYYLARGRNACPLGEGSLGQDSDANERSGIVCP